MWRRGLQQKKQTRRLASVQEKNAAVCAPDVCCFNLITPLYGTSKEAEESAARAAKTCAAGNFPGEHD